MPKSREYCCCAIPLVNAGIYATLVEQTVLGIIVGALSFATPSIVGSATPSFAFLIMGIIAFVAAGVQLLGFIGVLTESIGTYRRYVTIHGIVTPVAFSVAAAWIIWSAIGHNTAKQKCKSTFFGTTSTSQDEGETICDIFSWVSVGVMGAIWLLLAISQFYFFLVISSYGKNQRRDHDEYERVYDPSQPLKSENIPLESDPWDSRTSRDGVKSNKGYQHLRRESTASASDILSQPFQYPKDTMSVTNYEYNPYNPPGGPRDYPPHSEPSSNNNHFHFRVDDY